MLGLPISIATNVAMQPPAWLLDPAGWPVDIMKSLLRDKRPNSTKAAEVAGATLAFLGKKQLVKVKHYMCANLPMSDRSARNKYLTPRPALASA